MIRLYDRLVDAGVLTAGDITIFEEYCFVLGELNSSSGRRSGFRPRRPS